MKQTLALVLLLASSCWAMSRARRRLATSLRTRVDAHRVAINNKPREVFFQGNDETHLVSLLLKNYRGYGLARPVRDAQDQMNVGFKMKVDQFTKIDEHSGYASIVATISAIWHDEFLRWNHSSRWSHIDMLLFQSPNIFRPVIIPVGSRGDKAPIFQTADHSLLWVESNGSVFATATDTFDTACKINVANFPFDKQTCDFFFKVPQGKKASVRLRLDHTNHPASADLWEFHDAEAEKNLGWRSNPMWQIVHVHGAERSMPGFWNDSSFTAVVYTVYIERRAEYYLWNILLPTASMAMIQASVFFLPFSPERVMFAVTSVLAVDIFQSSLTAKVHTSSEPMPLVKYSTAQLMMGILITIESILVLSITINSNPLPQWIITVFGLRKDAEKVATNKKAPGGFVEKLMHHFKHKEVESVQVKDVTYVDATEVYRRGKDRVLDEQALQNSRVSRRHDMPAVIVRDMSTDVVSPDENGDLVEPEACASISAQQRMRAKEHSVMFAKKARRHKPSRLLFDANALQRHEVALMVDRFFLILVCLFFVVSPVIFFKFSH